MRSKAFFKKLRGEVDGLKIISFDCQKNLPLPKLLDQIDNIRHDLRISYSRQLYHRLTETDKNSIDTIRLVADGYGGQNKNCIVVDACCKWLLKNQLKKIEVVFPVTGHSNMPADRVFGVIERKLKKGSHFTP